MTQKRNSLLTPLPALVRLLPALRGIQARLRALPKPAQIRTGAALGVVGALGIGILLWRGIDTPAPRPGPPPALPSIGVESAATLPLDRPDYQAAPVGENTPLLLTIKSVEPTAEGTYLYKLSYTGLDTGVFNLTDFLVKPEGERLKEPVATVTIESAIPRNTLYQEYFADPTSTPEAFPYRLTLLLSALAWAGAGALYFWQTRRNHSTPKDAQAQETAEPETPEIQTLADLLRPLVEKAANKSISSEEKARLEGILFDYWSRDLELDHLNRVEQLRRILEHPQAGALLRTIEQWLYQPDSLITEEEINAALESYLCIPSAEKPVSLPKTAPPEKALTNASNIIAE